MFALKTTVLLIITTTQFRNKLYNIKNIIIATIFDWHNLVNSHTL